MEAAMLKWNLNRTAPLATLSIRSSHPRATFLPAYATASGKGFGELLKQKQSNAKDQDIPISSRSPSRGFGADARRKSAPVSKEADNDEVPPVDADHTVCSCGGRGDSKLPYSECCMPYHNGTATAPDGLSLLRARFSAYARGIVGYIVSTTHPENPDFGDNLLANAQATCSQLRFYNLDILHYDSVSDQESTVAFRVVYGSRKGGPRNRKVMEEKSYFVREGDTWLFRDGETLKKS